MRSLLRYRDTYSGATSTELAELAPGHALEPDSLGAYLCREAPLFVDRTLYAGVTNETLEVDGNADAEAETKSCEPVRDVAAALRLIRATLRSAIARAIGEAKVVAVQASGGIDSAVVLAIALDIQRERGRSAFAIAIDFDSEGSDQPHLDALEAFLGCKVVRIPPTAGATHFPTLHTGLDAAPILWPMAAPQLALLAIAREHGAERTLTGVGGDDFFDGSPRSLLDLLPARPFEALRRARRLRGFGDTTAVLRDMARGAVVRSTPWAVRRWRGRRRSPEPLPWSGPRLRAVREALHGRYIDEITSPLTSSPTSWLRSSESRFFTWLVHQEQRSDLLERFDPLFTTEVAVAVERIEPHLLLAGDVRRGLLRAAMRGRVPDSLLDRLDKPDTSVAFATFFEAVGGVGAFREELEGRMLRRFDLVETQTFGPAVRHALTHLDTTGHFTFAWAALATESFLLRHPELV